MKEVKVYYLIRSNTYIVEVSSNKRTKCCNSITWASYKFDDKFGLDAFLDAFRDEDYTIFDTVNL